MADEEGMVFVEQLLVGRQVIHKQRLEVGVVVSLWAKA
jgi:hypothetical protein